MEAAPTNREGVRELTADRHPIGRRRWLGPAPARVGWPRPQGPAALRGAARGSPGREGRARIKRRGRAPFCFSCFSCCRSWYLPPLPPAAMLRLLLLLPLLGAVGALPALFRRRRSASLPVGPYVRRYLSQQVGAGCGGGSFLGERGLFPLPLASLEPRAGHSCSLQAFKKALSAGSLWYKAASRECSG